MIVPSKVVSEVGESYFLACFHQPEVTIKYQLKTVLKKAQEFLFNDKFRFNKERDQM